MDCPKQMPEYKQNCVQIHNPIESANVVVGRFPTSKTGLSCGQEGHETPQQGHWHVDPLLNQELRQKLTQEQLLPRHRKLKKIKSWFRLPPLRSNNKNYCQIQKLLRTSWSAKPTFYGRGHNCTTSWPKWTSRSMFFLEFETAKT